MKRISVTGFFLVALLCIPVARGQQSPADQNGSAPIEPDQPLGPTSTSSAGGTNGGVAAPAGRSLFGNDQNDASQQSTNYEMLPLSGSEELTTAFGGELRNYFDASALFSGSADSAVVENGGTTGWGGVEDVGGGALLDHSWNASRFTLTYLGGTTVYQPSALYPAAMYHALSMTQEFQWKRVRLLLIDQFSYSPNSLFGGAGLGGPGLLAETGETTTTTLNPTYVSGSSILTGQTRLLSNSTVAEVQYNLSPRSSFTVTGDYGLLDYAGGGYISSHDYVAGAGYNHMLTAKDTLAVEYNITEEHFVGTPRGLGYQQFALAYAHEVTDRVLFQVGGGPELVSFHAYTPSVADAVTWSLNAGVEYRLRRTSLGANYSRGANAGSGVFYGSINDVVGGNVTHQFSRFLIGTANVGYSYNGSLSPMSGVVNQFKNWYGAVSLGRQFGRFTHISFNYGAQQQPYEGVCPVASCGTNRTIQTFGVALDVHLHAIGSIE